MKQTFYIRNILGLTQPGSTVGGSQAGDSSSFYSSLPQHNSSSSKRLNDYTNHTSGPAGSQSASGAAYEERMNSALRKAPPPSSYNSTSKDSSAVQKSKSYSNFDFVRRDLNFQVCITTLKVWAQNKKYTGWTQKYITTLSVHPVQTNKHAFGRLHRCVKQKIKISQKTLTKYVHPNGKHKSFILAILSNLTNINGGGKKYQKK